MISLISFAISNWRLVLALGGMAAGVLIGWHTGVAHGYSSAEKAVSAQIAQCEKDKQLTSEVSNGFQEKIADLNARVAALKLRPATCVPIASAPSRRDAAPGETKHVKPNGIPAERFIDYSAIAEKHRLQLLACQEFVRRERE